MWDNIRFPCKNVCFFKIRSTFGAVNGPLLVCGVAIFIHNQMRYCSLLQLMHKFSIVLLKEIHFVCQILKIFNNSTYFLPTLMMKNSCSETWFPPNIDGLQIVFPLPPYREHNCFLLIRVAFCVCEFSLENFYCLSSVSSLNEK